jgi:hypothetical protein
MSQDVPGANVTARSPRGVASQRSSSPDATPAWWPVGHEASTASIIPSPNQSRYAGSHSTASPGRPEPGPWVYAFQPSPVRMSSATMTNWRRARDLGVPPPVHRPSRASNGSAR